MIFVVKQLVRQVCNLEEKDTPRSRRWMLLSGRIFGHVFIPLILPKTTCNTRERKWESWWSGVIGVTFCTLETSFGSSGSSGLAVVPIWSDFLWWGGSLLFQAILTRTWSRGKWSAKIHNSLGEGGGHWLWETTLDQLFYLVLCCSVALLNFRCSRRVSTDRWATAVFLLSSGNLTCVRSVVCTT